MSTTTSLHERFRAAPGGEKVKLCIQCGTCSASCPAVSAMDLIPRQMWRMVQLGLMDEVLRSKAIWLCSICYQCQVRCPQGIPLTETIAQLKQLALERGTVPGRESPAFYHTFAEVMRRYGRVRELELMLRYFMATDPLGALNYALLGLTLIQRGKVRLELPHVGGEGRLDRLFARVAELEGRS